MTVTAMPKGEEEQTEKKKGKKVKLIAIVLVLVVAAAAAYFLVLAPKGKGEAAAPKPGAVLPLDSQQINLAAGHYLRLGIALQLTDKAPEEIDGSKALDAAIAVFSGLSVEDVTKAGARDALKKKLLADVEHRYDEDEVQAVMDVYFTEFVTQ